MTAIRPLILMLAAVALSGCAALSALNEAGTPLDAYELRLPQGLPQASAPLARDLVIETPSTGGALDTDRIVIRPGPFAVQYLPRARWTDSAPVLLQTLMIRAFEQTGGVRYVGRRPLAGPGDYLLVSELTDFGAEVGSAGTDAGAVRVTIGLRTHLVRQSDGAVIGSRAISQSRPANSSATPDLLTAMDAATGAALIELTSWALGRMGARVPG